MRFIKNIATSSDADLALLKAYREKGELQVLGILYERYMDLVYGVCMKYLQDEELSKDAVMQVFEELVVKLRNHEVENLRAWLYTVVKNHCFMQLRRDKNKRVVPLSPELMQSDELLHLNGQLEREDNLLKLERCLQTLPEEQQQSVSMFYLQQKSYHEIVAATGLDWKKVRSQIQNGRRNLKICMEKNPAE